ncbi:hypothetical protein [Kallipyga gabonensis]|uniref:hypothetical protein n=1 Tax=Kallipyga gabonensis TaxID=1686287 RepID=UPI0006B66491|nr:hypothetical protein [Kallipyga gabonensis]
MSEMENDRPGERKRVGKIRLFLILASLAWLVFCLILLIIEETDKMTILIHIFPFFIDKTLLIYSLFLLGTLWLMALLAFLWKKTRKKVAKGFLLLSNITLYERQNPFFIEEIEGAVIFPDDGYLPISQEEYWVKLNKNIFTLAVDRGYLDGSWVKMKVTLGEGEKTVEEEIFYPHRKPPDHKDDER